MKSIISWNVNGIRAAERKGFFEWLKQERPDVLCIQETKAQPEQLDDRFHKTPGYHSFWMSAERKGYSGVAVYTVEKPRDVTALGIEDFDAEGRTCIAEFDDFTVICCYFPNSQDQGARLPYKLAYCDSILRKCNELAEDGRQFVICGDFNIAHKPIDLARPNANEGSAGYLPEERAWMDAFTESGFLDTFRLFYSDGGHYSWWSYIGKARERNVGWRLDYHCVPAFMRDKVKSSEILPDVFGSDHCPVLIQVDM